jgi:hypothetical protein
MVAVETRFLQQGALALAVALLMACLMLRRAK